MNHAEMLEFQRRVSPELTPAEGQFARDVTFAESSYGAGWVGLARKLQMSNPEEFANVNNFGAITDPKPAPEKSFFMRDRWWRKYSTPEEGFRDAVRYILKPNVRAAVNRGDGAGGVAAMGKNGYFIEPEVSSAGKQFGGSRAKQIAQYTTFIKNAHQHVIEGTGEPSLLTFNGQPVRKIGDFLEAAAYVGGVVGVIWLFAGGAAKDE
jgi:hypothetical protein